MYIPVLNSRRTQLILASISALLIGCAYYLYFRLTPIGSLSDPSHGSLPSLVHMLTLTWMAFALTGIKRGFGISSGLLLMSLASEFLIGYPGMTDAAMLVTGFAIASLTATRHLRSVPHNAFPNNTALQAVGLMLSSMIFITGTGQFCEGTRCSSSEFRDARAIYLDYETLRSSIRVTGPRPLSDVSRVYIYQNAVLLNSRNQGIHVLDNTDPANPRNVTFIEIPGNTDISIRDNNIYVDSYIDLVTLSVVDPTNISEVARQQNIFEYDAYQNVPDDIYLGFIDESRGVVVDYELTN